MISRKPIRASRAAAALLCLAATALPATTQTERPPQPVETVRHNGETLTFRIARAKRGPEFHFAGWNYGAKFTGDRARDKHGNLYIVVPGTDHVVDGHEEFAHNRIISYVPQRERMTQWDVYWAVVLDPKLEGDFRSERELIVAAQDTFDPEGLSLDDLPAAPLLRQHLRATSFDSFARAKDGRVPRVLIVSAGFSVRGTVIETTPFSVAQSESSRAMPRRPAKTD